MRVYSNLTTRRLEAYARKQRCNCRIRVIEPHEDGRYFVTMVDGEPLRSPASLGWTDQHAIDSLRRHAWEQHLLSF